MMSLLEFKVFSALLSYPTAEMREALGEMREVISRSPLIAEPERQGLIGLVATLGEGDTLDAEERYCELFDRGRALSLHLFEHLHGESRDRGTAMVELKALYARAGFDLASRELPDYLPVILEYLSYRDMAEAHDMLADCAHILKVIARALIARRSEYAAVLQALLVIAGEQPLDVAKVPPAKERLEDLDRAWREEPAFSGDPLAGAHPPALARGGDHAVE
jgi:nitrate reductase delta subunit